jgi:GT2 family glycosyltransferase
MKVSVVTASHDHAPDLVGWFNALAAQTVPKFDYEVVLTNPDYPIDHPRALASVLVRHPEAQIQTRRIGPGGRSAALNDGLAHTTGDVVIFLADDFIPGPEFVATHLRFHEERPEAEAVGVGLAVLPPEYRTPFGTWLEESGRLIGVPIRPDISEIPDHFFFAGNSSVKRELLRRAGQFDERFPAHAWEDFEYGQRLRQAWMRSTLVPDAVVEHHHHLDLADREHTMRDAGMAARIYLANHPDEKVLPETATWPEWRHRVRLARARAQTMLTRNKATRQWWWHARLEAAFAEAYRKGG